MITQRFNDNWEFFEHEGGLWFLLGQGRGIEPVSVTLPHDAMISHPRDLTDPASRNRSGYPGGSYVYRKRFFVPADWAERRVSITFDGVYANAMVYLNDDYAGQCANGYAGFTISCDGLLRYGEENELRVMCSAGRDSRWYSGAGIYRSVYLHVGGPVRVPEDGFRLTTQSASASAAAIQAEVEIRNDGLAPRHIDVDLRLLDADGAEACRDVQPLHIAGNTQERLWPRLYVRAPRLWSPEDPQLYRAQLRLWENGKLLDMAEIETFGIRVLTLDNVNGLQINGQSVKLNGGCIHHDNGILGAATFARAEERRIARLRAAGFNAVRMAHHPASRELLAACDRHGMLVMDEFSDMWTSPKNPEDYGRTLALRWEEDLRSMVRRDYNHPSVVMYSLGNEIPGSASPAGAGFYRCLGRVLRQLDPTRYLTAGHNCMLGDIAAGNDAMDELRRQASDDINVTMANLGIDQSRVMGHPRVVEANREALEAMDIAGYNYATSRHLYDVQHFPNWISLGAETYAREIAQNWALVEEHPAILGDFVWAAWDYLGEPGIGRDHYRHAAWPPSGPPEPWLTANVGDFDLIGQLTPRGCYRQVVLGLRNEPVLAVQDPAHYADEPMVFGWSWPGTAASWSWPGFEGKPIRVEVYTRAEEAELRINGCAVARKPVPRLEEDATPYRVVFDVAYTPGDIEAVIYTGGAETGCTRLETAGEPVALALTTEAAVLDGPEDVTLIEIALRDAQGRLSPGADRTVTLTVTGAGSLQGFGSANPCTEEGFCSPGHRSWFGRALAAVRPTGAGEIVVTASAEGCAPAELRLRAGRA